MGDSAGDGVGPGLSPGAGEPCMQEGPRAGEDCCLGSGRESEFALPLPFCSIQTLH